MKLQPYNCDLSDKQRAEMLHLVKQVNKNSEAVKRPVWKGDTILGKENNRSFWQMFKLLEPINSTMDG